MRSFAAAAVPSTDDAAANEGVGHDPVSSSREHGGADAGADARKLTESASPLPSVSCAAATLLTDTQLVLLAIASAAAGSATVAAHHYALVFKLLFRKCFLLEELVALALRMGYEARLRETAPATGPPPLHESGFNASKEALLPGESGGTGAALEETPARLVDPLQHVGMLLPPGLEEDDYEEERTYFEMKAHQQGGKGVPRPSPSSCAVTSTASPVSTQMLKPGEAAATPGSDAATARWILSLLAKVHPDALPVTTLERICKPSLASSPVPNTLCGGHACPSSTPAVTSPDLVSSSISSAGGAVGFDLHASQASASVSRLLPHLKSSPAASPLRATATTTTASLPTVASPTGSTCSGSPNITPTSPAHSVPLSLLLATLLENVAVALWNDGLVEDAHRWLSLIDVRQLWEGYRDACREERVGRPLWASGVPPEEDVGEHTRACALLWPDVLAECRAADAPPTPARRTPSVAPSRAASEDPSRSGASTVAKPAVPRPRSGITLSALAPSTAPLPMTGGFDEAEEARESPADIAMRRDAGATPGGGVTATAATPSSSAGSSAATLRRIARRVGALRDLCGLMVACQTSEDVFYVLFSLQIALETQQGKLDQQRQRSGSTETPASVQARGTTTTTTTSGGLVELLIIANLLTEFFLSKRAQRLLMEEGVPPHPLSAPEQDRRIERAIRRACDEMVGAFTNYRCLTLYALESYGIPPPYHGHLHEPTPLLAPELSYVLASNVLLSTLNFATLYRLSKIALGVLGSRDSFITAPVARTGTASIHPNHTRRATEEEKTRRCSWTAARPSASATAAAAAHPPRRFSAPTPATASLTRTVAENIWERVKDVAGSWAGSVGGDGGGGGDQRHHPHDVRRSFMLGDTAGEAGTQPQTDLRFGVGGDGSYKERLVAARLRDAHAAGLVSDDEQRGQLSGVGDASARRAAPVTAAMTQTKHSGPVDAVADEADLTRVPQAFPDALSSPPPHQAFRGRGDGSGARHLLRVSGVRTSVLLLPSSLSPFTATGVGVPILREEEEEEEGEQVGGGDGQDPVRASAQAAASSSARQYTTATPISDTVGDNATVLHTAAVQLRSRSPTEAISLRLLTLLYRYPQIHTLEVVMASHVELVVRELNKALHMIQVAMRGRFGEQWWAQWQARREQETQTYYARALADAQRGGCVLLRPTSPSREAGCTTSSATSSLDLSRGALASAGSGVRVAPPSAPPLLPSASLSGVELSPLWSSHTLSVPTDVALREHVRNGRDGEAIVRPFTPMTTAAVSAVASAGTAICGTRAVSEEADSAAQAGFEAVHWDVPPVHTPDVRIDFSAFTTTSLETQESTRLLAESLQQQTRHDDDDDECRDPTAGGSGGVTMLTCACRRLLHSQLPLLQQYGEWRIIYGSRWHGRSLGTLFANCSREAERHARTGYLASPTWSPAGASVGSQPMLLVLELPPSTTLDFAEDDAGVREAQSCSSACAAPLHRMFIGAFLSDLLQRNTRHYYGTQDCFVFQLLVPGRSTTEAETETATTTRRAQPQLRVFRASRRNAQYINVRASSIVIGGGGGGSSLYIDDSLCHGATSSCATFASPPLSTWVSSPSPSPNAAADPLEGDGGDDAVVGDGGGGQRSLSILSVEVMVMDT